MKKSVLKFFILALCACLFATFFTSCEKSKDEDGKYTVSFYRNEDDLFVEKKYDGGEQLSAPTMSPVREGWDFLGWSDTADGAVIDLSVITVNGDKSFYAVWETAKPILRFSAQKATGGKMSLLRAKEGATVALPQNGFRRSGYSFVGWATSEKGEVVYADGAEYTMTGAKETVFYAVWTANENTIYFDGNGADEGSMSAITGHTDENIDLPKNEFTKAGYLFYGWAESPQGNVVSYDCGSYRVSSLFEIRLYAIWKKAPNVLYLKDSWDDSIIRSYSFEEGTTFVLNSVSSYKDRVFLGWALEKNGEVIYTDRAKYTMGEAFETTLYAVWERKIQILIHANGLNGFYPYVREIYCEKGKSIALEDFWNNSSNWCTLIGFSTVKDGEVEYSVGEEYTVNGETGIDFYAIWQTNPSLVYHYYKNTRSTYCQQKTVVLIGNEVDGKEMETRKGYTFVGWSTSEGGELEYLAGDSFTISDDFETHLYAVWEASERKIVFDGNGADDGSMSALTVYPKQSVLLPKCEFVREGYTFAGWCNYPSVHISSIEGAFYQSKFYAVGEPFSFSENYEKDEFVFYAIWTEGEHSWGEWKQTDRGVCFVGAIWERKCTLCDEKQTKLVGQYLCSPTEIVAEWTWKENKGVGVALTCNRCNRTDWMFENTEEISTDWAIVDEPNCQKEGKQVATASVTYAGYTFSDVKERVINKGHYYENGVCICGKESSKGLIYRRVEGGYELADLNRFRGKELIVADTYNGLPVVGVHFLSRWALNCIELPSHLEYWNIIAGHGLVEIYNKSWVQLDFDGVWIYDTLSGSRITEDEDGFQYFTSEDGEVSLIGYTGTQTRVIIPSSVVRIHKYAFEWNTKIEEVVISDGIKGLDFGAFNSCKRLKTVVMPRSVLFVESWSFYRCDSLETIVYEGSKEDWEKVSVGEDNQTLLSKLTFAE